MARHPDPRPRADEGAGGRRRSLVPPPPHVAHLRTALSAHDALARHVRAVERDKYRTAASVLCGGHVGVPQDECPACARDRAHVWIGDCYKRMARAGMAVAPSYLPDVVGQIIEERDEAVQALARYRSVPKEGQIGGADEGEALVAALEWKKGLTK